MPSVILVDTTVFLNVLDVPGFNQNRDEILDQLDLYIQAEDVSLLLPLCSIIETGNHIAQLPAGRLRRQYAEIFVEQVQASIRGDAPWRATQTIDLSKMAEWLPEFPDFAMRGVGIADLEIIKEWEDACRMYPRHDVSIWSLDRHLQGYARRGRRSDRRE